MAGLGDITRGGYGAIGVVSVGGGDVASGAEYFAHILGEVDAVGVPSAVLLDGKRASGDGLRGVPGDEPQAGVVTACQITARNLQVAAVDVKLMWWYSIACSTPW